VNADSDDAAMEYLLEQSAHALTRAGASAQDFLEVLPKVRAEIRRELYDEEYRQEIERLFAACKEANASQVLSEG
jgi:hypothetical protein